MTGNKKDEESRHVAGVGLGANLGDKRVNIETALYALSRLPRTRVAAVSRFYRTAPVGPADQDWFVNAAAMLRTGLSARQLLEYFLTIERDMGRVRTRKWGPRAIDLDLLFYDREIIREEDLVVPHPYLAERRFVLMPLMDIVSEWVHPILNLTPAQMNERLGTENQEVQIL